MTVHIGFVELCTTVTADGKLSNQATEVNWLFIQDLQNCAQQLLQMVIFPIRRQKLKMTMHIGFVELCMAATAGGDISNQAKE